MERRKGLSRKTALKPGEGYRGLKRTGGLERGEGLKRDGDDLKRAQLQPGEQRRGGLAQDPDKARAWAARSRRTAAANAREATPTEVVQEALERSGGRCVSCGQTARDIGMRLQPHHVFPVRATIVAWPALWDVADNVVMLCPGCHDAHERSMPKLPLSRLPGCAFALAGDDDQMQLYLVRAYGLE